MVTAVVLAVPLARAGPDHWAYRPPAPAEPPAGEGHPVDAFLDAARKAQRLEPAPLAPPRQWALRAAYTLTGLPPTGEQLARLEASPDEATWRALIDELLANPAYGERWARHWMDVARYADTRGYHFDQDNRYPFAYTYRDWLIRAFNQDLAYGRFIQLQLAADHLVDRPDHPDLAALGFLTVGPRAGAVETIDDRVDVVTRGFLASTVSCARCHDHKTDPITMEDYYSLYSIFENTVEPDDKPVIGQPADEAAYQDYLAQAGVLDEQDRLVRQQLVDHLRDPATLAHYLDLAWLARMQQWELPTATSEGFKRGKLRPKAILQWQTFLRQEEGAPRIAAWLEQMGAAGGDSERLALCQALAQEWTATAHGSELDPLARKSACPLSYEVDRIEGLMDVEDGNQRRKRVSEKSKLLADHPGSPPRAMNLADRPKWSPAVVFLRGNPAAKSEAFERQWLSFLGGGPYAAGKSPRQSLAEKIADPANPLTSRVLVNRVWAWHFGEALADPSDFGPQPPPPELQPLLDWLAIQFQERGHSLKELHRLLLTSRAFRLSSQGPAANDAIDQANTRFWKWNLRRLDFESMRDRMLASSGALRLQPQGGRSLRLEQESSDRRRSLYAFVDRYALPGVFVSFDLPHPDHHSPGRTETTVPQQSLYFLNGPLVLRQAQALAEEEEFRSLSATSGKIRWLYRRILLREPSAEELREIEAWLAAETDHDRWPDLIQMLWASNEFHFID